MKLQARQYTKILLLSLEEAVTVPDLIQIASLINSVATQINHVIIDASLAQLDQTAVATLTKLKNQYEKTKIKVRIVAPKLPGADYSTLVLALDAINNSDSVRITEIFADEYEFKQLSALSLTSKSELCKTLELPDPTPMDMLLITFAELEEKNKRLRQLYFALGKEIETLQKQEGPTLNFPLETLNRITEAHKRTLAAIETIGVFS